MIDQTRAFSLNKEILNKLKKYSILTERSQSFVVRKALEEYIDKRTEPNENKCKETKNEIIQN